MNDRRLRDKPWCSSSSVVVFTAAGAGVPSAVRAVPQLRGPSAPLHVTVPPRAAVGLPAQRRTQQQRHRGSSAGHLQPGACSAQSCVFSVHTHTSICARYKYIQITITTQQNKPKYCTVCSHSYLMLVKQQISDALCLSESITDHALFNGDGERCN